MFLQRLLSPMSGLRVRIKKLRIELETAKLQAETEHKVASEKRAMLASMVMT